MKTRISYRAIQSSALSAAVTMTAIGAASSFGVYFILSSLFVDEGNEVMIFVAPILGFGISSYILLTKLFAGLAYEASQRGVDDDVR